MGGSQQKGASGLCEFSTKTIFVPLVCDDYSLAVFLHEVAHVRLRHAYSKQPSHIIEFEAERWAQHTLRECGFRVTREILRSAKGYVREEILKDEVNGIPIDPAIRRWATSRRER